MLATLFAALLLILPWNVDATCHTSSDDCQVEYGEWSECDPCSKLKSRHLVIVSPAQFDGLPCPTNDVEHAPCVPKAICPADLPCPGQFDCKLSGRCVNDSLVCNGDNDCGNNEDEKNCTYKFGTAIEKCLQLKELPYLDQIGSGVKFVSGQLAGRVLDNQRYQGFCRKAFDGDRGEDYRLPFNVDNFHFHVSTTDDLDVKTYSSLSEYSSELDQSEKDSWSEHSSVHVGFSIFGGSVSESYSYSHSSSYKSIFNSMKDSQSTMFKVSATVSVAQFVMKADNILLDHFFEESINKLPSHFNAKTYFDFFDQYGTFYLHGGVLGGKYEHFYIFDNQEMKTSHQTIKTMSKCTKFSMSASIGFGSFFSASGGGSKSTCSDSSGNQKSSLDVTRSATHKIVSIDGGTTAAAAALSGAVLQGKGTVQQTKYQIWVESVAQNPMLLHRDIRPVCDLIQNSNTADKDLKISICYNATVKYLQKYLVGMCKPCKNGKVVNIQGQCQCACEKNYMGQQCNIYVPDGSAPAPHLDRELQLKSGASLLKEELGTSDTKADLKFVTENGVATNPPYMQWRDVGQFDKVIKMMEKRLFLLNSTIGAYIWNSQGSQGQYWISEYDEFLNFVRSTEINFQTLDDCHLGSQGSCIIRDFDVDSHNNFIISVKTHNGQQNAIYKVNMNGVAIFKIDRPCAMHDSQDYKTVYVTTTCTDSIVVSCPSMSPATVKVFTTNGEPEDMTQFAGFPAQITGIQHFSNRVWIHTADNKVAAYDLASWEQVFNYTGITSGVGSPVEYTQLSVDFLGNLIIAQTQNDQTGKLNYKLTIVEGTSKQVLAYVKFDSWNYCLDVATYRGKLYALCTGSGEMNRNQKSILVFDYLK